MKTFAIITLVSFSLLSSYAFSGVDNDNPCSPPDIVWIDTTYTINQYGDFVYGITFTLNGTPYWCEYNSTTGITTHNLPSVQYMEGFGGPLNAYLEYNFINDIGCEGDRQYFYFTPPDDFFDYLDHPNDDDDLSDDDDGCGGGNGNGNNNGNNGHGNNDDGVDVSNPGNGGGGPNGDIDLSGNNDDENGNNGGGNGGGNGNGNGNGGGCGGNAPIATEMQIGEISFNLYPNPTVNFITIESSEYKEEITVQLVNKRGEVEMSTLIYADNNTIDVSTLKRGTYFYQIISQGMVIETGQIIIN